MTTRDQLADAALAVLEREGLDALSMRKVAAELGVQAPSLYWHVRNKEELLDLLADALFRHADMPVPDGDWRAQVTTLVHWYRAFLLSHRDAVRVLGGRFVVGPHIARAMETFLGVLRGAGFSRGDATYALYLLAVVYVQGFVLQESVPVSAAQALGASPSEAMALIADRIAALPAQDFPALADSADLLTTPGLDEQFAFGLDRILDGLALRLEARPPNP